MGKVANTIWIIISVIIVLLTGAAAYISFALPNTGKPTSIKIAATQARISRGKYLSTSVTACITCHSKRNWDKYAAPVMPGTLGEGGERFGKEKDFPGTLYAPNITPFKLHDWTDGELLRAITTGETKDGAAIFPLMPYRAYAKMDTEDVCSIITYLRSLPAINNEVPARELNFPFDIIVNTIPAKAILPAAPDTTNTIADGGYLAAISNCIECHSKMGTAGVVAGSEFGGGWPFKFPNGTVTYAANITPDKETGIGAWSKEIFIGRFRQFADSNLNSRPVATGDFNTTMPWAAYAGMTTQDLTAIYLYLRTVKPIHNKVEKFERVKK